MEFFNTFFCQLKSCRFFSQICLRNLPDGTTQNRFCIKQIITVKFRIIDHLQHILCCLASQQFLRMRKGGKRRPAYFCQIGIINSDNRKRIRHQNTALVCLLDHLNGNLIIITEDSRAAAQTPEKIIRHLIQMLRCNGINPDN